MPRLDGREAGAAPYAARYIRPLGYSRSPQQLRPTAWTLGHKLLERLLRIASCKTQILQKNRFPHTAVKDSNDEDRVTFGVLLK